MACGATLKQCGDEESCPGDCKSKVAKTSPSLPILCHFLLKSDFASLNHTALIPSFCCRPAVRLEAVTVEAIGARGMGSHWLHRGGPMAILQTNKYCSWEILVFWLLDRPWTLFCPVTS